MEPLVLVGAAKIVEVVVCVVSAVVKDVNNTRTVLVLLTTLVDVSTTILVESLTLVLVLVVVCTVMMRVVDVDMTILVKTVVVYDVSKTVLVSVDSVVDVTVSVLFMDAMAVQSRLADVTGTELFEPWQIPNLELQPVPQYASSFPQYPCSEQHCPVFDPKQVTPSPQVPSMLICRVGDGDGSMLVVTALVPITKERTPK